MLTRLHVRSFKALADAEIQLRPFTALIGPNGAGKSTVLQAIELLGGLVSSNIGEHLESHHWDYADLPHLRATNSRISFEAELSLGRRLLRWSVELGARRFPGVAAERVEDLIGEGKTLLDREGRSMARLDESTGKFEKISQTLTSSWLSAIDDSDQERFPALVAIARWARGIRGYFFLDPVALRSPARGSPQDVGRHGEALAAFLGTLARKDRKAFDRVVERVRRQYPRLVTVRPKSTRYGWTQLEITERWNNEQATFNARQVSDGLLRLLAVASMHEVPSAPSVLLLDEVENGLHPHLLEGCGTTT
jgi:predicted ATPase